MSRFNHPQKLVKRDYIIRAAFITATIVILCIFCPHVTRNEFSYQLNAPWEGEDLIAKDSFEVRKAKKAFENEREEAIRKFYTPYYQKDVNIKKTKLDLLLNDLNRAAWGVDLIKYIRESFSHAYDTGVLPDSSYEHIINCNFSYINVGKGYQTTEFRQTPVSELCRPSDIVKEIITNAKEKALNIDSLISKSKIDFNKYLASNLTYDEERSTKKYEEVLKNVTPFSGRVRPGEKIVARGQIVTQDIHDKLESYKEYIDKHSAKSAHKLEPLGGQIIYISLFVIGLFLFFYQFRKDYIRSLRRAVFLWIMVMLFPILAYILAKNGVSPYLVPFCMVPVFVRLFFDSRTAFITHMTCVMLSAICTQNPFDFVCIQMMAGLTAIYALKQLQQRSELFMAVALVTAVSALTQLCLDMAHSNFTNEFNKVNVFSYIYIAANGGLLLLTYLLLVPIEKLFGFTSTVTLVELTNINHPILRALTEKAPGTFQHSMQVANLSAEVANRLGANTQLVRTAALYHDIGKLKQPVFFTENQSGNNPHNALPFEDSAQIIIQHVKNGLELASKHHLPQSIKAFIACHHGRSKTKYFYISYINQNPGKPVNEEIFTYPGPNPATLEQAILMMADSVEAASRSLPEYTEESITTLVTRIVDGQVKEGYFNHCPITFENIETCKEVFIEKLKTIYHTRVSYPELKK